MGLTLYNSLGRKLSRFEPLSRKMVTMYACGPTVHDYAHIGNFRTFVFVDVMRRYLAYKRYRVTLVMNITDVEDRIIEGIKRTGKSREELTRFYTDAFMEDLRTLNVQPADRYPRATENIDDMVSAIRSLMKRGYAYGAEDASVYFSIRKFRRYGQLSGIKPEKSKKAARTAEDHYEKEGANDFALWKAWDEDDGDVFWETPLGKGRPGWHIECSVMSMKYLGRTIDIHAGGADLRFPHHENEIAQSEALTGRKFVRHWEHCAMLNVDGRKMSKSLGNFFTLRDLLQKGRPPRAIRLFLMSAHYRDELNLTQNSLDQAAATAQKIDEFYERLLRGSKAAPPGKAGQASQLAKSMLKSFGQAMDDDLNTPRALASLFTFQRRANSLIDSGKLSGADYAEMLEALGRVDKVLGLLPAPQGEGASSADAEVQALVDSREEARRLKDYARADAIRVQLQAKGIVLQDTPEGPVWRRLSTPT